MQLTLLTLLITMRPLLNLSLLLWWVDAKVAVAVEPISAKSNLQVAYAMIIVTLRFSAVFGYMKLFSQVRCGFYSHLQIIDLVQSHFSIPVITSLSFLICEEPCITLSNVFFFKTIMCYVKEIQLRLFCRSSDRVEGTALAQYFKM